MKIETFGTEPELLYAIATLVARGVQFQCVKQRGVWSLAYPSSPIKGGKA